MSAPVAIGTAEGTKFTGAYVHWEPTSMKDFLTKLSERYPGLGAKGIATELSKTNGFSSEEEVMLNADYDEPSLVSEMYVSGYWILEDLDTIEVGNTHRELSTSGVLEETVLEECMDYSGIFATNFELAAKFQVNLVDRPDIKRIA